MLFNPIADRDIDFSTDKSVYSWLVNNFHPMVASKAFAILSKLNPEIPDVKFVLNDKYADDLIAIVSYLGWEGRDIKDSPDEEFEQLFIFGRTVSDFKYKNSLRYKIKRFLSWVIPS